MQNNNQNPIVQLTFTFSLHVIEFCEELEQNKRWVIANQLLRSGTSIGANVREAQNAESKQDFIHKFKIAAKEADETRYWLELCNHSDKLPDAHSLLHKIDEIQKILTKIIATSKQKHSLIGTLAH